MATFIQFAWAAGVFEGEGCIHLKSRGHPRLTVSMTDQDVVERLREVLGGKVYGPYGDKKHPKWKKSWRWEIGGLEEVERVYLAFQPWLGERRRQRFEEVITSVREWLNSDEWREYRRENARRGGLKGAMARWGTT